MNIEQIVLGEICKYAKDHSHFLPVNATLADLGVPSKCISNLIYRINARALTNLTPAIINSDSTVKEVINATIKSHAKRFDVNNTDIAFDIVKKLLTSKPFRIPAQEIQLDKNIADLGLSSMSAIDLLMDIENYFGISIPSGSVAKIKTIRDLCVAANTARIAILKSKQPQTLLQKIKNKLLQYIK